MPKCLTESYTSIKYELIRPGETLASLSCGDLHILQKKDGYRFSLDAYLLSAFVEEKPGTVVVEIGSGSGVVAVLLAGMKRLRVTGVEVQADLAEMSQRTVALNELADWVDIVSGDIRDYAGKSVAAVITNPPYRPMHAGRLNPVKAKAIARHEVLLDLETLLASTYAILHKGGRFYCIYPAWRMADLFSSLREHKIEPKRMVMVHSTLTQRAELILVMAVKNGGRELKAGPPFSVYGPDGAYSRDMEKVFSKLKMPKSH
jgi:tRNA1(Val) A37 N6-methylase TrmN6